MSSFTSADCDGIIYLAISRSMEIAKNGTKTGILELYGLTTPKD